MQYSLTALTTVADCDALLSIANKEQDNLNLKKMNQEKQYLDISSGSTGVDAELIGVNAEIAALVSIIAGLLEGPGKQGYVDKLESLQHTKYLLEKKRRSYGTLAVLQKECVISTIEKQVEEKTAYIAALTQRRNELAA